LASAGDFRSSHSAFDAKQKENPDGHNEPFPWIIQPVSP
jgi:hypothetical protein